MIDYKEIRYGNKLLYSYEGDIITVLGYSYSDGVFNDRSSIPIDPEELDPIPITEEWLLKFGFEPNPYFFDKDGFNFYFNDGANGNWYPLVGSSVQVEYVHQLQNLYFALVGEELTIKE